MRQTKATVREESRHLAVSHDVDVVVAGGGLSGFAAAMAAARAGADVLLLDMHNAPGGMATFQGIAGFSQHFCGPDGGLVVRGVFAEMFERYAQAEGLTWDWSEYCRGATGKTWLCYDPELLKLVLTEMLDEAGVKILFNTWVSRGWGDEGMAKGVIYENKQGRQVALGKCVVDCTGDADVAASLGAPMTEKPDKHDSFLFRLGNVDLGKLIEYLLANPGDMGTGDPVEMEAWQRRLKFEWEQYGHFSLPDMPGSTLRNLVKRAQSKGRFELEFMGAELLDRLGLQGRRESGIVQVNTGIYRNLDNLNADVLTQIQISGRKLAFYVLDNLLKPFVPGFEKAVIVATASQLGVRSSRTIQAQCNIRNASDTMNRPFADVVAVVSTDQKTITEIPYRSLLPLQVRGLLVASGRSFPNDSTNPYRETSTCTAMGQAAGVAATLSAQKGLAPDELKSLDVQKELLRQGVYLGTPQRLAELGLIQTNHSNDV